MRFDKNPWDLRNRDKNNISQWIHHYFLERLLFWVVMGPSTVKFWLSKVFLTIRTSAFWKVVSSSQSKHIIWKQLVVSRFPESVCTIFRSAQLHPIWERLLMPQDIISMQKQSALGSTLLCTRYLQPDCLCHSHIHSVYADDYWCSFLLDLDVSIWKTF